MLLYRMPGGFFVELTHDTETNEVHYCFASGADSEDDCLADYAMLGQLPDWVPESEH